MLGLAEQVHRHPVGRRRAVGEDQDLARPGDHVDADRAEDAPLGARDVGVAGAGDLVDGRDRRRAVGERADRLRAADGEQAVDAGERGRGEDERGCARRRRRAEMPSLRAGIGATMTISPTPATLRRHRVHQHARRIRRLAARHVDADALDRRHLLAEQAAVAVAVAPRAPGTPRAGARGSRGCAPAAASSALRCAAGSAASAAASSARPTSSAAIDAASMPSKRRVHSSTAASPRARTSARMASTLASISRSVSAA